jgi:hypothetical protein
MSYNTVGVVPINSYNEAVARYEGIKPIRGKTVRPLGERRYHHRSDIVLGEDRVFLNYYAQAFVEWRPDNTFTVFPPRYTSAFMTGDLTPYLPFNISVSWDSGRYVLTIRVDNKLSKYFIDQPMTFKPKPNEDRYSAQFELVNKPVAYHKRMRPNAADKYIATFKPFFDWCDLVQDFDSHAGKDLSIETFDTMSSLRKECGLEPDKKVWDEYYNRVNLLPHDDPRKEGMYDDWRMHDSLPCGGRWGTKYHTPSAKVFLDWIADPNATHWVKARTFIITQAGKYSWKDSTYVLKKDGAIEYLKNLVLHVYRDDCFKLVPVKDGDIPTKRNNEYFESFTFSSEIPLLKG